MSILRCVEGTTLTAIEVFLDDFDQPLYPAEDTAGPVVKLIDEDRDVIAEVIATVHSSEPGAWAAQLPVPKMGLRETVTLKALWVFVDSEGEKHRSKQQIQVSPASDERTGDIIIMSGRDTHMTVVLPFHFDKGRKEVPADRNKGVPAQPAVLGDILSFSVFRNNTALMSNLPWDDPSVKVDCYSDKTVVRLPNVMGEAKLEPSLVMVEHIRKDAFTPTQYTFKAWTITPQILVATNSLEQFINKARLSNVIPELEYTQSDLLEYLARGLNLFNSFPPTLTAFNGRNMQGMIFDGWLQCSTYYALSAQLQAEGAMAFDFSGQEVSLNVDRTPAIESALGRIETALNDHVKPMKKLLARAGVISGDGSQGGQFIDGAPKIGALSIMNAPTSRLPWSGRGSQWSRGLL